MMSPVSLLAPILLLVWFCLSGITSPLFLFFGAVTVGVTLMVGRKMGILKDASLSLRHVPKLLLYAVWLLKEMVKSGLAVTRIVWSPHLTISPICGWISTEQTSELGQVIYANSITLTPGTISVDAEPQRILVHALEASSITNLQQGGMDTRVLQSLNPKTRQKR